MNKTILLMLAASAVIQTFGQNKSDSVTVSGYAEAYYSYEFNQPSGNTLPVFLYNYNRHNEFNVNLAFLKANYGAERVRANIALAVGTYGNANYAAEHGVLKNILEANAGYKLSSTKNLWLDIGILPSHIGFESAIGKDNWTLTRSMVAENSPYFESGARLSYTSPNDKLTLAALALNGWQRITRVEGNSLMSWGTQINFKPSGKLTINYSTFLGTDKPDSARAWRYYHNVYGIWLISPNFGVTAGVDVGTEADNCWYAPVAIIRYAPTSNWAIAYRAEFFRDKNGVIIATGTPNGFATIGSSLNIDYLPANKIALRLEGRFLGSRDNIFTKNELAKSNTGAVTFSMAVSF